MLASDSTNVHSAFVTGVIDSRLPRFNTTMALTVEPGIYIPAGSKGVAKRWWNIGVRIEDDVAVTGTGNDVLTRGAPKDADAIEKLMNGNGRA